MKIVFITDEDSGGAGQAVYRYSKWMTLLGHDCKILVRSKVRSDDNIYEFKESFVYKKIINAFFRRFSKLFFKKKYMFFDLLYIKERKRIKWLNENIDNDVDAIILAWGARFISFNDLCKVDVNSSIFLSYLVDMQSLTGGCHFSYGCTNYQDKGCRNCPGALNIFARMLVENNYKKSKKAIKNLKVAAYAPVEFIVKQSLLSGKSFYSSHIIQFDPYLDGFGYVNNKKRDKLFLGAYNPDDTRKGYDIFVKAINIIENKYDLSEIPKIKILIPKNSKKFIKIEKDFIELVEYDFAKNDEELSLLYKEAKVFVSTSLDDTGPSMLYESLASGVPIIASNVGATSELLSVHESLGLSFGIDDSYLLATHIYDVMVKDKLRPSIEIEKITKDFLNKKNSLDKLLDTLKNEIMSDNEEYI